MRYRRSVFDGNALLQRVKRYASTPTLYRAPDPAAVDLPQAGPARLYQPAASAPATAPVVATLHLSTDPAPQGIAQPIPPATMPPATAPPIRPAVQPLPAQTTQPPATVPPATVPPATAPPATVPPATVPPAQPVQRSEASPPASPASQPAPETPPAAPSAAPAGGSDDWGWINDGEWNRLKDFMAGHQQKLAEERAEKESIQRSPEDIQRAEAERRAEADLARRQELARSGQLPRANVVYLSPEEKAAGTAPLPEPPAVAAPEPGASAGEAPQGSPPAGETSQPDIPDSPASEMPAETASSPPSSLSAPAPAGEQPSRQQPTTAGPAPVQRSPEVVLAAQPAGPVVEPGPQFSAQPDAVIEPAAAPEELAAPEILEPPEPSEAPAATDKATPGDGSPADLETQPNVGQRLMRAARSLFRREDDDAVTALAVVAPDESETTGTPIAQAPEAPGMDVAAPAPGPEISPAETPEPGESFSVVQKPDLPPASETPASETPSPQPEFGAPSAKVSPSFAASAEIVPPTAVPLQRTPAPPDQAARPAQTTDHLPDTPAGATAAPSETKLDSPVGEPLAQPPETVIDDGGDGAAAGGLPDSQPETGASESKGAGIAAELPQAAAATQPAPAEQILAPGAIQATEADDVGPAVAEPGQAGLETIGDDQDTIIAPLPLQDVWPVEEMAKPSKAAGKPAQEPRPVKPVAQRKAAGGESVGEEVHSAIRDVAPAQFTDSSIELVTPRRPRPVAPPPKISRQADEAPEAGDGKPAPPIDQLPEPPDESQPATVLPSTEVPPTETPPTVAAPQSAAPAGPHMVQTDIGELPSDLWNLLGERPPAPRPSPPLQQAPVATAQREVAVAQTPAATGQATETQTAVRAQAGLVTQFFSPPVLQRIESESETTEAGGETTSDSDEAQGQESGPEVDIDALARKVLPEIKRRLAIDWERGRGRIR